MTILFYFKGVKLSCDPAFSDSLLQVLINEKLEISQTLKTNIFKYIFTSKEIKALGHGNNCLL